jgi:hypothetical protein
MELADNQSDFRRSGKRLCRSFCAALKTHEAPCIMRPKTKADRQTIDGTFRSEARASIRMGSCERTAIGAGESNSAPDQRWPFDGAQSRVV